ncbi:MAG: hypothetical protein WA849_01085 [Candidatus Udaeobacter sp.]
MSCPKIHGTENPTWLANELVFYSIAKDSGLNMPFSAVIEVEHELCWGSEYVKGRDAVRRNESEGEEILRRISEESRHQLLGLARALLLDVALLNSDRKPWNMLVSRSGDSVGLCYFDHDKSLLGDGRESRAHPRGDLARIDAIAVADWKVRDYLACTAANRVVLDGSTNDELREVFASLALNSDSLDAAKHACPEAWLSEVLYSRLRKFLLEWWRFLRSKLLDSAPRDYFSKVLSNPSSKILQPITSRCDSPLR